MSPTDGTGDSPTVPWLALKSLEAALRRPLVDATQVQRLVDAAHAAVAKAGAR